MKKKRQWIKEIESIKRPKWKFWSWKTQYNNWNESSLEEISNKQAGREKESVDLKTDQLRLSSLKIKKKKWGKKWTEHKRPVWDHQAK